MLEVEAKSDGTAEFYSLVYLRVYNVCNTRTVCETRILF